MPPVSHARPGGLQQLARLLCERIDRGVLRAFAGDALEPAVISRIIEAVFAAGSPRVRLGQAPMYAASLGESHH